MAREHCWRISAEAHVAFDELKEQADAAEYWVDVVQGSYGEPFFLCQLGYDDELEQRVAAIPGAFSDGKEWWVPAYRAECAASLLDIVQSCDRLDASPAGWRLLEEPDETYPVPAHESSRLSSAAPATESRVPATSWRTRWIGFEDRGEYDASVARATERIRELAFAEAEDDEMSFGYAERAELRRRNHLGCVQHVLHACGRQKLKSAIRWIESFQAQNELLVIVAHHRDMVEGLKAKWPDALCLTGAELPEEVERAAQTPQTAETRLILCPTRAARQGVDLARAAHLIFVELDWSAPEVDLLGDHAYAHRIVRDRTATVWYLAAPDSIDAHVLDIMSKKHGSIDEIDQSVVLELGDVLARDNASSSRRLRDEPRVGPGSGPLNEASGDRG
jgi:hypothetical protein